MRNSKKPTTHYEDQYANRYVGGDPYANRYVNTPFTLRDKVILTIQIVVGSVLFVAVGLGILWVYASWGGSCLESGGKIVGDGPNTHCEGGR